MLKRTVLAKSLLLAFSGTAALSGAAFAQQAPVQELQRVEITGSAIKRLDAETAVPITVLKAEDLKKQGVTSIEQIVANVSAMQVTQGTSQVVGLGTGGAAFADLRGLGANKTLVLLNGRRIANNAFDSSAPDLNMIPFAALDRVEVLRDGASALYGSDAVGGVINFITRKDFTGGTISIGADKPRRSGGKSENLNLGFGFGDLTKDSFNVFGVLDYQKQQAIGGLQRPYNTRYAGGLSPTPSPANYYQGGDSGNPAAPTCASGTNTIPDGTSGCLMTTSSFVDYVPKSERVSGLLKGTLKLGENHELGMEYFASRSKVNSQIAPVPYGALRQNPFLPDGVTPNRYYPGNSGNAFVPNIPLDPTWGTHPAVGLPLLPDGSKNPAYVPAQTLPPGAQPGYVTVKWRDLPNGPRADENINDQQRLVLSLTGLIGGWDYQAAVSYNQNKVKENLAGYSDGGIITAGVLNGVINPFGAQDAAGDALLAGAALNGNIQNAKGTTTGFDAHASRELGDWLGAGRQAAVAIGGEAQHQKFTSAANAEYAAKVVSSTGIDPNLLNAGSRNVYAAYTELNVPIFKSLDVTAALRYDKYSDFGNTTNPKVSFRYQPLEQVLVRGSYSTGFRAPSLYDINQAQAYTNTTIQNDPSLCPGGVLAPGATRATSCDAQFLSLQGGSKTLKPEKSKNATFGLVFEPAVGLSVGVDFWWIKLKQQIDTLDNNEVFDPVKAAGQYASLYHRNPQGKLSTDGSECPDPTTCGYVDLRTQNLGGVNTNGIDLSANYKLRANSLGQFNFTLNSTYISKYEYQNSEGGEWIQNVGAYSGEGPIFRWQHNLSVNWTSGAFGAGAAVHFKSGYLDSPTDSPVEGFRVPSYTTVDAYGSWSPVKGLTLLLGFKNLFDRDPPLSYQTQTFQAGYDPRFTDPAGRTAYVRGTYTF